MPNRIYQIIINLLLFFFIVSIVKGVTISGGSLLTNIVIGLAFGALMAFVGNILQFFKITVNTWSELLMSIVLSFLFFFVLGSSVISFQAANIDIGIPGLVIKLSDGITTLLFLSFLIALSSVGLKQLGKRN